MSSTSYKVNGLAYKHKLWVPLDLFVLSNSLAKNLITAWNVYGVILIQMVPYQLTATISGISGSYVLQ